MCACVQAQVGRVCVCVCVSARVCVCQTTTSRNDLLCQRSPNHHAKAPLTGDDLLCQSCPYHGAKAAPATCLVFAHYACLLLLHAVGVEAYMRGQAVGATHAHEEHESVHHL